MPLSLFYEWKAYNQLDPIGAWRADWRAAMQAAANVNLWRGRAEPVKAADYLPVFNKPEKSPGEMYQAIRTSLALGVGLNEKAKN